MRRLLPLLVGLALGAWAQSAFYPEGPQALPLEGGLRIGLPGFSLDVDNNTLNLGDLINVAALLGDPQPTDVLLLAAKVPKGQASVAELRTRGDLFSLAWPFGEDPLTGMASFGLGVAYGLEGRTRLHIGSDLVALAQEGTQPGDTLSLEDTQAAGALFDRLSLRAALPVLDGLLAVGAEVSLLYSRLAGQARFAGTLTYDDDGFDGTVSLRAPRGGGGFGYQVSFGVQTRLPTLGAGVLVRTLGKVHYRAEVTEITAQATDAAALDILDCFSKGESSDQVVCSTTTGQTQETLDLPTEMEAYAYYPLFLGEGEPLYLLARARGAWGGPLEEGWRFAVGASYRLLPTWPLALEVGLGGPSGFALGVRTGLELPGMEVRLVLIQRGGFLLGAKGTELGLSALLR